MPDLAPDATPGPAAGSAPSVWAAILGEAAGESRLWADVTLPPAEREEIAVFSQLGDPLYALGLETIYEGYLVHYGRSRLFAPTDRDTAILFYSTDYAELIGCCDRVAVMYDGQIVTELEGSAITEEALVSAALNITTPVQTSSPAAPEALSA